MVKSGEIVLKNVRKTFVQEGKEPVEALKSVSGVIQAGEIVALIGTSGCGKSTLLRIIAGLDAVSEGTVEIDGQKVAGASEERGFVFQDPTLYPWLTVYDNIAFGLKIKGGRKLLKQKKAEMDEIIELVDLKGFEKHYPHQLSGGMQSRVALARALIKNPKVLLFDEPFAALDAFTKSHLQNELLKIKQARDITMIIVTHDVEEAVYLADRVFAMTPRPGEIQEIMAIHLPRPRNRAQATFATYKEKIYNILGFKETADLENEKIGGNTQ